MKELELFKPVLDADEEILKVYKPNKFRTYFGTVLVCIFITVLFMIPIIASFLDTETSIATSIGLIVFVVVFDALTLLLIALWYNKTIFAVTNKRILIRTGYIGVDYKGLDYDTIGALTVNVNWLDKLLKKDTGTLSFGSMASPMINTANYKFSFLYIKNPYEVYREVKSIIDANKPKK